MLGNQCNEIVVRLACCFVSPSESQKTVSHPQGFPLFLDLLGACASAHLQLLLPCVCLRLKLFIGRLSKLDDALTTKEI